MNIRTIALFVALPVATFALGAALFSQPSPQEPGAEMQDMSPKLTKWHKAINKGAGEWSAVLEVSAFPGSEPMKMEGIEINKPLGDGLWMTSMFKGDMMGMPFEGRSIMGYDPRKEKVQMVWVDTFSDGWSLGEGVYDKEGKILTMMSTAWDPMQGKEKTSKMVEEYQGPNQRTLTMYDRDAGGEWAQTMKITYTRKK